MKDTRGQLWVSDGRRLENHNLMPTKAEKDFYQWSTHFQNLFRTRVYISLFHGSSFKTWNTSRLWSFLWIHWSIWSQKTLFMLLKMCLRIFDEILDAQLSEKCLNWNGEMIWWRKIASYWDQNNPKSKRHRLCSVSLIHVEMMLDEVNIFSCVHSADRLSNNIMSLFQNHSNCFSFP